MISESPFILAFDGLNASEFASGSFLVDYNIIFLLKSFLKPPENLNNTFSKNIKLHLRSAVLEYLGKSIEVARVFLVLCPIYIC